MRQDAQAILQAAIGASLPDAAVKSALRQLPRCSGRLIMVSVGKAGWQMAKAASDALEDQLSEGLVITKYQHRSQARVV